VFLLFIGARAIRLYTYVRMFIMCARSSYRGRKKAVKISRMDADSTDINTAFFSLRLVQKKLCFPYLLVIYRMSFYSFVTIVVMSSSVSFPLKHLWRVSDLLRMMNDKPNTSSMPKKPPMVQPMRMAWLVPLS